MLFQVSISRWSSQADGIAEDRAKGAGSSPPPRHLTDDVDTTAETQYSITDRAYQESHKAEARSSSHIRHILSSDVAVSKNLRRFWRPGFSWFLICCGVRPVWALDVKAMSSSLQ